MNASAVTPGGRNQLTATNQAHSQDLRFGGAKCVLEGKEFLLYAQNNFFWKRQNVGGTKIGGTVPECPPVATGLLQTTTYQQCSSRERNGPEKEVISTTS